MSFDDQLAVGQPHSRGYYYNAETMVYVRGRVGSFISSLTELGLTHKPIQIIFKNHHIDVHTDDYGPRVPAEVLWMLSEATITMELVHFDYQVLAICVKESMGVSDGISYGSMKGAGWPLGAGQEYPFIDSDNPSLVNSYIRLYFGRPAVPGYNKDRRPWRFPSCYLTQEPIEFPLGSERSAVRLRWRAIPYSAPNLYGDVSSKDAVLFDHEEDAA